MYIERVNRHLMKFFDILPDILLDALKDSALILPFMFVAFIVIGMIERGAGRRMVGAILAADRIGPLPGGLLGVIPSCGFSAAASNLYGAGLLTTGTLLAVYLSTSDEMIAVMVSQRTDITLILKILAVKAGCAIVCGFLVDGIIRLIYALSQRRMRKALSDEETDEDAAADAATECGCTDGCCAASGNLFLSALKRTARILIFIYIISVVIGIVFSFADTDAVAAFLNAHPIPGCIISALLGLIPNCAVSVALTEFYLDGIISAPMMLCGLMTGAGSGLLVLFRTNQSIKESLTVLVLLFICGLGFGTAAGLLFF